MAGDYRDPTEKANGLYMDDQKDLLEHRQMSRRFFSISALKNYTAAVAGITAMEVLSGCCENYDPDAVNNLLNNSSRIDCECRALGKKGYVIESYLHRVKTPVAAANDVLKYPTVEILGAGTYVLGEWLDGDAEAGAKFGREAVAGFFDALPGGITNDKFLDELACLNINGAFDVIYKATDTDLGRALVAINVAGSLYLVADDVITEIWGGESQLDRILNKTFGSSVFGDDAGGNRVSPVKRQLRGKPKELPF